MFIFAPSREEHDVILNPVLSIPQERGILLMIEKCEIGKARVEYLGQVVSGNGI